MSERHVAEVQRVIRDGGPQDKLLTGTSDYEKARSADSVVDEHLRIYREV
jgi:hypothetical protein